MFVGSLVQDLRGRYGGLNNQGGAHRSDTHISWIRIAFRIMTGANLHINMGETVAASRREAEQRHAVTLGHHKVGCSLTGIQRPSVVPKQAIPHKNHSVHRANSHTAETRVHDMDTGEQLPIPSRSSAKMPRHKPARCRISRFSTYFIPEGCLDGDNVRATTTAAGVSCGQAYEFTESNNVTIL